MNRTECFYEQHLRKLGYIQIYDGETAPQKQSDQFAIIPEERKFFIRYYQLVKHNHMVKEYVKLVYDLRTGYLKHFPEHYHMLPNGAKKTENMLALFTQRA